MTDKNELPSWSDGAQEEITHLLARREYLTERMSAATDPNLRSSFAYEINVLEARLADLTSPPANLTSGSVNGNVNGKGNHGHAGDGQRSNGNGSNGHEPPAPPSNGNASNGNHSREHHAPASTSNGNTSNGNHSIGHHAPAPAPKDNGHDPYLQRSGEHVTNGHVPNVQEPQVSRPEQPAESRSEWPSDHDEIPEEFYRTLEISSADLDATAWPNNAARPEVSFDQAEEAEPLLEPVEYHGDEHHRHRSHTIEVQPMDEAPVPYQPSDEPGAEIGGTETGQAEVEVEVDRFADVIDFRRGDQTDTEGPQLFAYQDRYGSADPFDNTEPATYQPGYRNGDHANAANPGRNHLDTGPYQTELHQIEPYATEPSEPESDPSETSSTSGDATAAHHIEGLTSQPQPSSPEVSGAAPQIDADRLVPAANRELFEPQTPETRPDTSELQEAAGRAEVSAQRDQVPRPEHRARRHDDDSDRSDRSAEHDPFDEHQYFVDDEDTSTSESHVQLEGFGRSGRRVAPTLLIAGFCFALLAGVLWFGGGPDDDAAQSVNSGGKAPSQASDVAPEMAVANVRDVLERLGVSAVVDFRDETIYVGGPVPSRSDLEAVSSAVQAVAGEYPVDTSALVILEPGPADPAADATTNPAPAAPTAGGEAYAASGQLLQSELDRILAVTPLIFDAGLSDLTALHQRVLNSAVLVLQSQPGAIVTITGYTDEEGTSNTNRVISLSRAENVKAYLVSQGVTPESLRVEARGEESATGSAALAGLERRVEFEVETAPTGAAKTGPIRIGVVAPSARNDLAFTQSMVDAVNLVAQERGFEVSITDNTLVADEAAAALEDYAAQGYDLVIAHGSQFGAALIDIAPRYPDTAFAWGTASDTFGLPNVYAYDAAAEEGGYVLGTVATMMSGNKVSGVVGPIDVGDAGQYVKGFQAGAIAQDPASNVLVTFTGSFSDIGLASEAAQSHIDAGAEVLTGSAQMVVGAISTADQQGVKWFGTQSDQSSLAPSSVVASQVYHWEVAIGPILDDVAAGALLGTTYTANLGNGGLIIQFNPAFPIAPEVVQRAEEVTAAIVAGTIDPPK